MDLPDTDDPDYRIDDPVEQDQNRFGWNGGERIERENGAEDEVQDWNHLLPKSVSV